MILYHTLLTAGWSYFPITKGTPSGDPVSAVAGAVPLQAAHAAHDQRGLHTVQECTPLLLPGELRLLPGSLQPQGTHSQVPSGPGVQQGVSVVPAKLCAMFDKQHV